MPSAITPVFALFSATVPYPQQQTHDGEADPGLGIDLDEKAAAKYPITDDPPFDMNWGNVRRRDGTVVKP